MALPRPLNPSFSSSCSSHTQPNMTASNLPDPLPTLHPPSSAPPRKKRRTATSSSSRSVSPSCPPSPTSLRRRAPPLERLPRWLLMLRTQFVTAHGELPLPQRVAVRGKPFYDWDAWVLALLNPQLWRRRGPWQRLIASCIASKPVHIDSGQVADVKAALVRIVVAEVVAQLVSRSEDQLTPEDRNWITSVASRQRGRNAKKPTLMLLFDLAFAVFDLASYCRCSQQPSVQILNGSQPNNGTKSHRVADEIRRILADEVICRLRGDRPTFHKELSGKRARSSSRRAPAVDPIVMRVLQVVHKRSEKGSEALIQDVVQVIDEIEKLLSKSRAKRWYDSFASKMDAVRDGLLRAAQDFALRLPALHVGAAGELKSPDAMSQWLYSSFDGSNWACWAELANDCNHIILTCGMPEEAVREEACRQIVKAIVMNANVSVGDSLLEAAVSAQLHHHDERLTVRRLLDVALSLEHFHAFFVQTHGNSSAVGPVIRWGVQCFEGLVQQLARLRDVLLLGSSREIAMITWSARSVDIANYYRETVTNNARMSEDMDRAVQNAFAEASWPWQSRAMKQVMRPGPVKGVDSEAVAAPQFWLATLDLSDPLIVATAIVPWDPHRSVDLLDKVMGLNQDAVQGLLKGNLGLPLWDYRRVVLFRLLSYRGLVNHSSLILERLQPLFLQKLWREGGNFSNSTIQLLETGLHEGNVCAQTTYGLLLAGEGAYWDVARSWANCKRSVASGIQKLYLSAATGDLEACTALSHILAQCGSDDTNASVFNHVTLDQVYSLFKFAVRTQNAHAVLNLGVLWRYGVGCVEQNDTIAIDAFLMALQGGISGEARAVAARHLVEAMDVNKGEVTHILKRLMSVSCDRQETSSTSSPYRIDDFCGSSQ